MHLYLVMFPSKVVVIDSKLVYAEVLLSVSVCINSYMTPATVTDSPSRKVTITLSAKAKETLVGGELIELHVNLEKAFSGL